MRFLVGSHATDVPVNPVCKKVFGDVNEPENDRSERIDPVARTSDGDQAGQEAVDAEAEVELTLRIA